MSDIKISYHALKRFVERYELEEDPESVRIAIEEVLPLEAINLLGNGTYPDKNNKVKFVIKDGTIITVLPLGKLVESPKQHFPESEKNATKKQERDFLPLPRAEPTTQQR